MMTMTINRCSHDQWVNVSMYCPAGCNSRNVPNQTAPSEKKESKLQPVFTITVEDPQKVGDPIRAFTMYTVHTKACFVYIRFRIGCRELLFQTASPTFSKPSFSVLRRYSDFLWLYETLSTNNPGVVVPPVPEKSPFGRFDGQFVQQRRTALENCINKMANHPVLCKDADLKLFLESDTFSLDVRVSDAHRKPTDLSSDRSSTVKRRLLTNGEA
jgi:sorting nexin-1/2